MFNQTPSVSSLKPEVVALELITRLVEDLRATSKRSRKIELLRNCIVNHPDVVVFLEAVYDEFRQFYLSSEVALRQRDQVDEKTTRLPILQALLALERRNVSGHEACRMWCAARRALPKELRKTADSVLDKDLKAHLGLKTVNKVLHDLGMEPIRTWKIALGFPWKAKKPAHWVWEDESGPWYASRKLDGVRCLMECTNNSVVPYSRKGKPFLTLARLVEKLKAGMAKVGGEFVLDGEVALRTSDGRDDFQRLMKFIRRKDYTIKRPVFYVFDFIELSEFRAGRGAMSWQQRQEMLKKVVAEIDPEGEFLIRVPQWRVKSRKHLKELQARVAEQGWEGLILRKRNAYTAGRTPDILKVKVFHDLEARVDRVLHGPVEIVRNGKTETITAMTAAVIRYRGVKYPGKHKCKVGSGWTRDQRELYHKHPELLEEMLVTVRYFEETEDKHGKPSLRFPVVKVVHGKARTT